jgi:hypothetical protein
MNKKQLYKIDTWPYSSPLLVEDVLQLHREDLGVLKQDVERVKARLRVRF